MADSSAAQKTLLAIAPAVLNGGKISVEAGKEFTVMLNPAGYTHTRKICYNEPRAFGKAGAQPHFNQAEMETVSFKELLLDGTGVVPRVNGPLVDVKTQIRQLSAIVYKYNGDSHEPNLVRLLWGSFIFIGRLKSMTVDYNLFKPSGEPLRAKVKLDFAGFMSKEAEKLTANKSSPDLTHMVEVKAGDTLPLLCHRIYENSAYYLEVARINGITNFRDLQPGIRLRFPPLR